MTFADTMLPLRLAMARLHQHIGWAGIAGISFVVAASAVTTLGWLTQMTHLSAEATPTVRFRQPALPVVSANAARLTAPDLPPMFEVPLLMTQIKYAAASNGLEWRAANYRIIAATPAYPASLEVRWTVKAPYPNLRGMLVQLASAIPAFTIREFSASRPNADTADVDAKLVLAVLLQDGATTSDASSKSAP